MGKVGRPLASSEQRTRAYNLWEGKMTVKAAHLKLQEEFSEPVSHGTVGNWFKSFKDSAQKYGVLDSPFRWSDMHRHELPDESARPLLTAASFISEYGDNQEFSHILFTPPMTFRDAVWLWRTYCAVEGLIDFSVFGWDGDLDKVLVVRRRRGSIKQLPARSWVAWSRTLAVSERAHDVAGLHLDVSHIEHHLAYRPWESDESKQRYIAAYESGHIPRPDFPMQMRVLAARADVDSRLEAIDAKSKGATDAKT